MDIKIYQDEQGKEPFVKWLESIKDKTHQARIRKRLVRIELGNFGDWSSIGDGIFELRLHFGPGFRIYFSRIGNTVIIILAGGDKNTQQRDIEFAKLYLHNYEHQKKGTTI